MYITIPEKIIKTQQSIDSVWLAFEDIVQSNNITSFRIPLEHIALYDWVNITNTQWENSSNIYYKVTYKNRSKQTLTFNKKSDARYGILQAKIKLGIPQRVKDDITKLISVTLIITNYSSFEQIDICLDVINSSNYIEISLDSYQNAVSIIFNVVLCNDHTYSVEFTDNKYAAIYKHKITTNSLTNTKKNVDVTFNNNQEDVNRCIRKNNITFFKSDKEGAALCLKTLKEKTQSASQLSLDDVGQKNLIYYTVYFNTGYVELFNISVQSILKNTIHIFDILVITDSDTQQYIEKTECSRLISLKYLITDTPIDGVEASKNKCKVFKYSDINQYNKILFLDCDTVAINDFTDMFIDCINPDTLYSVKNTEVDVNHFKAVHHGFTVIHQSFVEEMKIVKQVPFNAGQFLFRNSLRMEKHFDNLLWFMSNWPLEYFFEQCFMCYYFADAYMIDVNFLAKYIHINSTKDSNTVYVNDKAIIHFIAPPLNAVYKINYINNYLQQHTLNFIKENSRQ